MSTGEISFGTDLAGSAATGGSLTLGQTTFGWIDGFGGASGDQDWYLACVQAGVEYTIYVAGADFGEEVLPDAFLEIIDVDGDLIQSVGPDEAGEISYTFIPTESQYVYFNVGGLTSADTGAYSVTLLTAPDDHGGNFAGADPIQNAVAFSGLLGQFGDEDSFVFNAVAGVRYFWSVATDVTDLYATLDNAGHGRELSGVLPNGALGQFIAVQGGEYRISFSSSSLAGTGSYVGFLQAALTLDKTIIAGSTASDTLLGTAVGDEIWGWDGHDSLTGGSGADILLGNRGDDSLKGGAQADTLFGEEGNDVLAGGTGLDILAGGAGKDFFVFNAAVSKSNADRITDFNSKLDTFRIDNAFFKKVGPNGKLAADAFFRGKAAADKEDRIVYDKGTGSLFYDADGKGGVAQVKIATLANKASLALSDFIVI